MSVRLFSNVIIYLKSECDALFAAIAHAHAVVVIALHARRLTLTHPTTKQELTLEASLPESWRELGVE